MSASKNYTPTDGYTEIVKLGEMAITKLHFGILNLTPEATFFDHSDDTEVALIALGGHCTLLVGHNGNKANGALGERSDVFNGEACIGYIPHHTTYEVLAGEIGVEIAVCKVPSHSESAAAILEAGEAINESETHLRIWENALSDGIGDAGRMPTPEEAICFQRFLDGAGSAVFEITRTENERFASSPYSEETVRVRLYNNDVLAVPEQHNIVSLTSEGVGYQLWMQPDYS
ncbi:MAG: 5-deoxy-glucuronate isomerase [Candidatus Poribacteria bacterium]|nr:5-deoxy-glucuronate isomerase [Candidatus Poribacteria bacterium]MDE0325213.1 5-deoxy-glucuronate isomerase [Candidatus Poribacteria bacterium]